MRLKYGMYLRVLDALPEDAFHAPAIPGMRTPAELVVHTSGAIVRDVVEGVASGEIVSGDPDEKTAAESLATKAEVLDFARECWERAAAAAGKITDEKLTAPVRNSWGLPVDGTFAMVVVNDEFLHHRGQLFAYARARGIEPPFMWGFQDNPEGFRPGEQPG
jgi:uncharacterized damage-inducible protein DinB